MTPWRPASGPRRGVKVEWVLYPLAGVITGFLFGTWAAYRVWKRAMEAQPPKPWVAVADRMPAERLRVNGSVKGFVVLDIYWGQGAALTSYPGPDSWQTKCWRWVHNDRPLLPGDIPTHWQDIPDPYIPEKP